VFDAQTPIFALAALSALVLVLILPSALIEATVDAVDTRYESRTVPV